MKTKLIAGMVAVIVALGAIGGTAVLAQSVTPTTTAAVQDKTAPTSGSAIQDTAQQKNDDRCTQWQDALAKRLGIPTEKLQQAQKDAAKDFIDQAVKDGKLTQEQANAAKQKIDSATGKCLAFPHFDPHGKVGAAALGKSMQVALDAAAKALNMTSTDLQAALKSGKTMEQLAKEKNVDVQTVRTAVVNAEKAAVDQAVKDGKLTQQQADALKKAIDQHGGRLFDMFEHHPNKKR
ncbi:MAG: DUF2680 domain-containing protein [Chloroflexi bacterium]|nr:DUF2680 domain-containing protein [Chloroflexota bacterium]